MRQKTIAQLTKDTIINDFMQQTGWSRKRVIRALALLEIEETIRISADGSLDFRVI